MATPLNIGPPPLEVPIRDDNGSMPNRWQRWFLTIGRVAIAIDSLADLAAQTGTGFATRISAAGAWALRTFASGSGIAISNPAGIAGNPSISVTELLLALFNLATTGLIVRTGAGTVATRTLTAAAGIVVTNGSGVAGDPTIRANGWVLIEALIAAGSASLVFDNDIVALYDDYRFELVGVTPAADDTFVMEVSEDNGATWKTTNYTWTFTVNGDTPSSAAGGGTTSAVVSIGVIESVSEGLSGTVLMQQPLATVGSKQFQSLLQWLSTDTHRYQAVIGSWYNQTAAVDAIRFRFTGGNIATGVIRLYGLSKT